MIQRCQDGIYSGDELSRGMSNERINRFFEPTASGNLRVNPSIREIVQFKQLNLLDNFDTQGKFDVIFCRNVLIYFDADVKEDILRRLHARLNPGGILFLGASESVGAVGDLFKMVHCQPGIGYQAG
jgi:chemotaxis protein methyltransferase CheR